MRTEYFVVWLLTYLLLYIDSGNEASLVECITDEKRGVGEGGIPVVCINEYVNTLVFVLICEFL